MKFFFATLFFFAVLIASDSESLAKGMFSLVGESYEVVRDEDGRITDVIHITGPTYAVLELSGENPYDHTDVESLKFTPEGSEVLGYVGVYQGEFDESLGLLIEDNDGLLVNVVDLGGGVISLGASFIDNDPPTLNTNERQDRFSLAAGPARTGNLYLAESVRPLEPLSGEQPGVRVRDISFGNRFVSGRWIRVVPEPTTLLLALLLVAISLGHYTRSCVTRNFPGHTSL